jgi:uncharacterized protein (TIGR02646 family)
MKYIEKSSNEPSSLIDWKTQDKMYKRQNSKWKRFGKPYKENFKKNLINEQGGICCYCEQKLKTDDSHLEHLLPQKLDVFSESIFEYRNLLCSCQKDLITGDPRHCGNSKGSWYDKQLFVSPLDIDCELKFKYSADGRIKSTDEASKETISHLQLDIDKLNSLRESAIEPFIIDPITLDEISAEEAQHFAKEYLKQKDGKYNEFYTTIQYLFEINEL